MAGFQKIYTSENEYLYDLGKTTGYFDEEYYDLAKESGSDYQYLQMMASLKQTGVSDTFDPVLYYKLSGEERFNYLATENFMDKSSKDYITSSLYFKQREKQIRNEEIYASLNGFEKTINSIGGWLGNAFLQVGGIVEGLIDAGATFVGARVPEEFKEDVKEFIASDATGYNAAQASMNDWINKYTFIDKNVVTQAINDVTTGIFRMVPMIVGGALSPFTGGASAAIGTTIYYVSMAGNTAEQAIVANPDINYGNLLVYTAGSVGLEALTEWASGKLFGDDLISSLMKGQKYAPTGTIVKTIAKNFGTEALEEAVAELFGSMMYAGLVTGDVNDIASIGDIFYAAVIGGLTGAVMSGGQIATTKRMVVTQDGQLKYRSDLTNAELKTAKKLKLSESWGLQSLIRQSQQALSTPDNVTQLMAKTGKSISQLQTENAAEYEKAVAKDTETKTQQAKAILDLANLMSTIGVEQFTKSAEILKNNADLATEYVNNFLNHTDVANKKASEVFSANYPGKSFTPTAIPSKPNQALAEALRQAFPQLKVVFGTFGSEDGLPVRAINKGETYLFLDENMVSQKGYQQVLHETIRYQLADQLMQEINILDNAEANGIVKLVTDLDVDYDKLTKEQKLSIAQILCFDPVNSRRLFKGANKTHAKIFNYITDQSEYVKKFGRQTEANKMRYHDLLEIRNMYIKNIAETISNNDDVQTAKEQYNLTDEETKTKIIDKTENTILNDTIAVMRQNLDKNVIARQEAIEDLLQNRVEMNKSVPFDWSNLYNEAYYKEDWIAQIKQQQQTQDFHEAIRAHLLASHKVDFSVIEHSTLVDTIKNNVSIDELNKLAETLFTKEYLDTNPDLQVSVADALYTMVQTEDTDADSIVVKDDQILGTGKLEPFIDIQLLAKKPTFDSKFVEDIQPYIVEDVETEKQVINNTTLYKGVTSEITDDFDNTQGDKKRIVEGATWLTDNIEFAKTYANMQTGGVLTRTVTVNNPLVIDAQGRYFSDAVPGITADDLAKYAQEQGYDSLIIKNIIDAGPYLTNATDKAIRSKPSTDVVIFKNTTATINKVESVKNESVVDFTKETKNVSKKILQGFAAGSKALSQVQYSESNSKEYYQVSRDMIDAMADTFALVNNKNYDQIRKDLENSTEPYAKQALEIFDFYTIEMQGKFNAEIRQKIENQYQKLQTEAGQRLYLQSVRVAERKPISSAISTLQKDGFNVTLTDKMVLKYDAKLKDKDAYIKELESRISDLEKQIKQAKTEIEKAALSKELKDVADKKLVIESGSNVDIMDYIVRNTSTLEEAAKIQDDILQKLVSTAVKAQEEGKKVGYYVYNENGELKPFPEASKKLAKTLKKLKSFRMWAMLSSPVTWVRNWIGNQGMRALDGVTNVVEGFMNKRFGGYDQQQMKFTETKGGKELYEHIARTNESYIMTLVRGEDVKYETTAEKAAAIKRQERKIEYDSANAFQKLCLKAQDMTDWGLSTGFLGDEPVVFNSICKNMGNLVANNIEFLLQGIRQETNTLRQKTTLTDKQKSRLNTLKKALSTKNSIDVFNALSKEETERLFDVCKERSFQQYFKNPNALSKWFSKFGTKHPVYAELVSWVMPFPKVAANVLSMAYRYSPLNFFNGLAELSKYRQTQQAGYKGPVTGFERAKAVRAFSEASVGTFMLIAGAIFSAMGLIDIDEDDYMGPSIKIGDFKISLTNLAPSMTTFSTAAAMVWAWKNDKSGVTQALSTLYDNTLLGNVENLLTYGSLTDVGKNAFMSYVSQYIPAILKLVNKTTTGGVKKDKSGTYLQRLIKTLGSYVPGVSSLVPDKIDPYTGEKMYQAGSDNWFLNLLASISPLTIRWDSKSEIQRQAEILGAETTGLSGSFKINDVDYSVSNKEKYAKYRANYIESQFDNIVKGKQEVTVEDENGKRITTTYDKLNDKQKKNVINRLYTEATTMTKIKWWTDQGNKYVVTNRDQYNEYRKMFDNIIYKKTWTKSKFVES